MSPVPAPAPSPSDDVTAQSLGLGKYVAVGFGGRPTWIDPAADDWADVVANGYGWVQFEYLNGNRITVRVGTGDGANQAAILANADGAFMSTGDNVGSAQMQVLDGVAQAFVAACVDQTDPVLDLQNESYVSIFKIGPHGEVGGVTPNDGDQLTWDAASGSIKWKGPLV